MRTVEVKSTLCSSFTLQLSLKRKEFFIFLHSKKVKSFRRGNTLEATPVPIPNTAVKLQRADDTAFLSVEQ
jgi:hypothetical protein